MSDPLHDRVVAAIGQQYDIEGEIGRGGMSVVYRARDIRLNRSVAIKVLPPELAYDPAIRTRFTREAQTSAQLSHPHIVPIYDVGERDGIAYFVMAMLTGGNLAALLAREPRQPIEEVRRIIAEIADALSYAHTRGVIHRDIKPDNILLDLHNGRSSVTDFGIARAIEAGTRLTLTGVAVGTPTYMSPEQAVGEREVDGRTDIYSLGVVAYQMLTGRVPFTAGNSMALLLKHLNEGPPPIAELRPDTPRALREAVERALVKSPEDRWPTAEAMRDAIRSDRPIESAWRGERREPVRYSSPRPASARHDPRSAQPPRRGSSGAGAGADAGSAAAGSQRSNMQLVMEPEHLASLTPAQRDDLRLWFGRVNLFDRIKAARGYALLTIGAWVLGLVGFAAGVDDFPPAVLAPLVPLYMSRRLWLRGRSLRAAGLKLRRVFLMPRARWVIPAPPQVEGQQLEKLAPRELLEGQYGLAIRRAAEDGAAIKSIIANLSKPDRAMLPDVEPTVKALLQRVVDLAQSLQRMDQSMDPRLLEEIDARIASMQSEQDSPEGERRLALLQRQRGTIMELAQRRAALARQLDNAGLALGNLRLDLIKLRSSGMQAALSDVTSATQEARALSREIASVLEAAAEVRAL